MKLKIKFSLNWSAVKNGVLSFFRQELIKKALMAILGTCAGFKAWIIGLIVGYAFDSIAVPIAEMLIRDGKLIVDKQTGKIKVVKLNEAFNANDQTSYDSASDDIFNS